MLGLFALATFMFSAAVGQDCVPTCFGCVGVEDLDPLARVVVAALREADLVTQRGVCDAELTALRDAHTADAVAQGAICEEKMVNSTSRSIQYLSSRLPLDGLDLALYLPCDTYQTLVDIDTSRDRNIVPQIDGVSESECYQACSDNQDCNVAVHRDASCWLKAIGVSNDTVEYRPGFNSLYSCGEPEVLDQLLHIKLQMNELVDCVGFHELMDATIVGAATLGPVGTDVGVEECWESCADYVPDEGDQLCETAVYTGSRCLRKAASVDEQGTVYSPGSRVLYPCRQV